MKAIAKTQQVPIMMRDTSTADRIRNQDPITVSICGSYHRHLKKMHKLIKECKKLRDRSSDSKIRDQEIIDKRICLPER